MDRPSPSSGSAAGQSLVGTLLAFGLLLAMITAGVTLATATEARFAPTADLRTGTHPLATDCPRAVLHEAEHPAERSCVALTLANVGDSEGTAHCQITDVPDGAEARFVENGISVLSLTIADHATKKLLIRVDGAGKHASELGGVCDLVPPPSL